MESINRAELIKLIQSVFPRLPNNRALAVLVDLPQSTTEDNLDWAERRSLSTTWAASLKNAVAELQIERVDLLAYANVGSNNADLPEEAFRIAGNLPPIAGELPAFGESVSFAQVFADTQLFLAPTEFSTTAPLKIAAKKYGFRAATMPGFSAKMIPALRLDYDQVNRQVGVLKAKLDEAESAVVVFVVDGADRFEMKFDLRFRTAHASGGRFAEAGTAGNLPSGEAYIVPYEGELDERSETGGILPVQFGAEMVLYQVEQNRAVKVLSKGNASRQEAALILSEPAYSNIAELGLGVLAGFGLQPIGENLLDEKLGLHVAFGRSDHFGGIVGSAQFSSPKAVVHLDRIYIPTVQPRVSVKSVTLGYKNGQKELLMQDGEYVIFDRPK